MKQFIFLSLLVLLITQTFAASNTQASNNSSQPIILLGEINDQSPGAGSYAPRVPPPINKALQEQNAISAIYDQKQEEIAEEEDFDEMNDFGMFGEPFGGYGDMYAGPSMMIPIVPVNNNSSSINYVKPKLNENYESQLPNGDIMFKQ